MKNWLKKLYEKTVEVAKLYTGTFIVVMILNQLLFFGFCLNPICLIAAMPHVLLITVVVGTFINKMQSIHENEKSKQATFRKKPSDITQPSSKSSYTASNKNEQQNRPFLPPQNIDNNTHKPAVNTPILCPLCKSEMVLRTAKQGRYAGRQFHGCARYPQCKGIINI